MYNATYVVNYCTVGSSWIGFDDVEVVGIKVSYAGRRSYLVTLCGKCHMKTIGDFL